MSIFRVDFRIGNGHKDFLPEAKKISVKVGKM